MLKNNQGAGMAEYALLIALIAVVCIGAIQLLGQQISATFTTVAGAI